MRRTVLFQSAIWLPKADFDHEWYARKNMDYMLKMILLTGFYENPNLAINDSVAFNLC